MNHYDEQLRVLQAQCARKKKLEAVIAELRTQQEIFTVRAQELEQIFRREQADVDRLEGKSLSAFFYQFIGKMDEKLTREKQEACTARLKYSAAARELAEIEEDLCRYEAELDTLRDCGERYAAVLKEKTRAVKNAGGCTAEQLLRLEERAAYLESQIRELDEAFSAGRTALDIADRIADRLSRAQNWGAVDLLGGGLIVDLVKHGHLDEAQAAVEQLQSQLRRFRTELADVTIDADFQVSIDGFLRVADYFFDGIFADWAVLDRIHKSRTQVEDTRSQICDVLNHLQNLLNKTSAEREDIRQKIEELVGSVPL